MIYLDFNTSILSICFFMLAISENVFTASTESEESNERTTGKIVGGSDVDIEDYPYQVSISYKGVHNCGGSILNRYFILTAAHCTNHIPARNMKVRAGSSFKDYGGEVFDVITKFEHPRFNADNFDNDIALLVLRTPLTFSDSVQPVKLPEPDEPTITPGVLATVSGWGKTNYRAERMSSELRAVDVPIMSRRKCQRNYRGFAVTDSMICAGYPIGGQDACSGDSGGPLILDGIQIGVVSWGVGCASMNSPGVYASILHARKFIENISARSAD